MDIISKVLRLGDIRPIKISVLLNCYEYLFHKNKKFITNCNIEDIKESVLTSQELLSGAEFDLYVSLVTEALLVPFLHIDGSLRLRVRDKSDEVVFLNQVLCSLSLRNDSQNIERIIEQFKESLLTYGLEKSKLNFNDKWSYKQNDESSNTKKYSQILSGNSSNSNTNNNASTNNNIRSNVSGTMIYSPPQPSPPQSSFYDNNSSSNINNSSNNNSTSSSSNNNTSNNNNSSNNNNYQGKSLVDKKSSSPRNIERNEYIIKFLARVRKQGMDLLFPQVTHDRVIACIYTSMLLLKSPAHRELIDIVMEIKDTGKFFEASESENISKTKIRGLLALLKHSDILKTKGLEGQPVELFLSLDCINSYMSVRAKHDQYLIEFIFENKIVIPRYLLQDIVWAEPKEEKLKVVEATITKVHSEYKYLIHNVHQRAMSSDEFGIKRESFPCVSSASSASSVSSTSTTSSIPPSGKANDNSDSKVSNAGETSLFHSNNRMALMSDSFGNSLLRNLPTRFEGGEMYSLPRHHNHNQTVLQDVSRNGYRSDPFGFGEALLSLPHPLSQSYAQSYSQFPRGDPSPDLLDPRPPSHVGGTSSFQSYSPFAAFDAVDLNDDILNPQFHSSFSIFTDLSSSNSTLFTSNSMDSPISSSNEIFKPFSSSASHSQSLKHLSVEVSPLSPFESRKINAISSKDLSPSIVKSSAMTTYSSISSPDCFNIAYEQPTSTSSESNLSSRSNNTSFSESSQKSFTSSDSTTSTLSTPVSNLNDVDSVHLNFERIFGGSGSSRDPYSLTPDNNKNQLQKAGKPPGILNFNE